MMTPLDIQTVKFAGSAFGYKKTEVDAFLAEILVNYEYLYRAVNESNEKIKSMTKMLDSYKTMEDTMKNTLIVAQQSAEQLTQSARSEADSILGEANRKSHEIIGKATKRLDELNSEYENLKKEIKSFILRSKAEFNVQMRNLDEAQKEIEGL